MLEVFLQNKRNKTYPGTIWMDVKVWDLLKETANQGKVSFFGNLLR